MLTEPGGLCEIQRDHHRSLSEPIFHGDEQHLGPETVIASQSPPFLCSARVRRALQLARRELLPLLSRITYGDRILRRDHSPSEIIFIPLLDFLRLVRLL